MPREEDVDCPFTERDHSETCFVILLSYQNVFVPCLKPAGASSGVLRLKQERVEAT